MADVLVFAAAPVGGSVDPSPDPKFAEVWATAPVGGGVYLVRTGVARLLTPSLTDPDRDFFNDEAELAAYPTSGLVVGDWVKIKGDDEASQVLYGARWNGSAWVVGEAYEQGTLQTDRGVTSTRVELVNGVKARVNFWHANNDVPGDVSVSEGSLELTSPGDVGQLQASVAVNSGATSATAAVKIAAAPLHLTAEIATPDPPALGTGQKVYPKSDGYLYALNDAGTERQLGGGGGDVATDAIWDALGDLAVGTGPDTAIRLAVGTNGKVLEARSTEPSGLRWVTPSGGGGGAGMFLAGRSWMGV